MKRYILILLLAVFGFAYAADPGGVKNNTYHATKEAAMKAAGFDVYDTQRNREFNSFTISNHAKVRDYLGSAYAGEWTEYGADGIMRQVVALTRSVHLDKSVFANDYYKFVYLKYSYEELESVQNRISDIFMKLNSDGRLEDILIHTISINVEANKVYVYVLSKNEKRVYDELGRAGFNLDMIEIRLQDALYQPVLDYHPGEKILAWGQGLTSTCTGGFVGNIDIYHVLLTAGHCFIPGITSAVYYDSGNYIRGPLIGHLLMYANGGLYGMDYAAFSNSNFLHTIHAGILIPPSTVKSVKAPLEITLALNKKRVCAYGKMSGWNCESITSINNQTTTTQGVTLYGLASVAFCSVVGDSGGPVVLEIGDNALGMVVVSQCSGFGGG